MKNKLKRIAGVLLRRQYSSPPESREGDNALLLEMIMGRALPAYLDFSYGELKGKTLSFVKSMKLGTSGFEYKYSKSCEIPNIYSSAYACMILSMFGEIEKLTTDDRRRWAQYFDGYQSGKDGLFYDESLRNEIYDDTDWWGAKHLVLHLVNVYIALGCRPKHPFYFLEKYYDEVYLKRWLDEQDWRGKIGLTTDIDNRVMNIATALHYQRDFWGDERAAGAIRFMQGYLLDKINPQTGMWGYFNADDKGEMSRMVQFAYHLFPLYFYDSIEIGNKEKIIDCTLRTQNMYGGFGVQLNSSACEDIDSIDILIRLSKLSSYRNKEIKLALGRAFVWVLANQNDDGGYVFRRNEPMFYGHGQMNSGKNESAMFPTWFRTLTVAYLSNYFGTASFKITKAPGFLN